MRIVLSTPVPRKSYAITSLLITVHFSSSTETDPTAVVDDEEEEEEVTTPSGGAEAITSSGASYASSDDFTSSTNSNERASLRRCGRAMTDPDSLSDESGYHDDGTSGSENGGKPKGKSRAEKEVAECVVDFR